MTDLAAEMTRRTWYTRDEWVEAINALDCAVTIDLLDSIGSLAGATGLLPGGVVVRLLEVAEVFARTT